MPRYLAVLAMFALLGMVLTRVFLMRRQGISAMHFGAMDQTDCLILPFALFYFYMIVALTFDLPAVSKHRLFNADVESWLGVFLCVLGLCGLLWSLVSFGRSFRVGIDQDQPDRLVTTGIFAWSRNPIYVAFALVLTGEFLVFANWVLLIYIGAAIWLFHRQVLREEAYLTRHHGQRYVEYCRRVRRYL